MSSINNGLVNALAAVLDVFFEKRHRMERKLYKVEKGGKHILTTDEEVAYNKELMKRLKFGIMLFLHIMYEDDGKLSRKELKGTKELIERKDGYLTKENMVELRKLLKTRPGLYDLLDYAKSKKIEYDYFEQMFNHLKIILKDEDKYDYILDRVERKFIMEKEFM